MAAELDRVAALWLDRGVDGFRLDAVRYLVEDGQGQQADRPGTHAALKAFAAGVRAHKPRATLVGEAWADTFTISDYYGDTTAVPGGDELPLLFDFPLADAMVKGVIAGSADLIDATLRDVLATYPTGATDAPFLTNHDQVRVATQLGNDLARLKLAAALLLTMPGTPFIYYGEELGLQNGAEANDEAKRTPMPWDGSTSRAASPWATPGTPSPRGSRRTNVAAQLADPGSLLSRYRQLIRLRQGSAALRRGALGMLTSGSPALLAFTRVEGAETVLVVHNLSAATATTARAGGARRHRHAARRRGRRDADGRGGELDGHAAGAGQRRCGGCSRGAGSRVVWALPRLPAPGRAPPARSTRLRRDSRQRRFRQVERA